MTLGSGGELVEMLRDTATLLLPATRSEIEAALLGLRSAPLLQGYRGRPRGDLAAALDAIEAVQRLALGETVPIVELEINPLIVAAEGCGAFAADALIVRMFNSDVFSQPRRRSQQPPRSNPGRHQRPAERQRHRPHDPHALGKRTQERCVGKKGG